MNQGRIITQPITPKISASIISTNANTRLDQPLWAINWLDLKRGWLYELYNRVAYRHATGVGAYPIFKGKLIKTLQDHEPLRRDMLLIVRYPKAQAFLNMISSRIFQIKSLLRNSSVNHFQFGFMQKVNQEDLKAPDLKYNGKLKYMVHVCEDRNQTDVQSLLAHAATKEVFPHFIGHKSAILGLQKSKGRLKTLNFMLTQVLVFSGFDTEALEELVQSDRYQQFVQSHKSNFIGLYERKI